jgi:single-strand DNA-binding protein
MSINRVEISGNLGHSPELRATASGTPVCSFSVCVNDRRKDQETGEWEDVPNWVDVVFFGSRAESLSKYLHKGSLVFIAGHIHQNKWEDKNGNKRQKLEVIGDDIQFGSKPDSGGDKQPSSPQDGEQGEAYDDIPF